MKLQPSKNLVLGCVERSLMHIKQELYNMECLFEQKEISMGLFIEYQKWYGQFETICEAETQSFIDLVEKQNERLINNPTPKISGHQQHSKI